jgi:hypothetical protein
MDHHAVGEGWDPSFEGSYCGGKVMESGLNGLEAIPMVMKVGHRDRCREASLLLMMGSETER